MIQSVQRIFNKLKIRMESKTNWLRELHWANVFHDTIRGIPYLDELSLSPNGYACNYSLIYLITRISDEYKPSRIVELGLGESSKVISTIASANNGAIEHTIIEHGQNWISAFKNRFQLSAFSRIIKVELIEDYSKGFQQFRYDSLEQAGGKFDFYIVDGPFGSQRHSRCNILELIERLDQEDEFVLIIDDCQRIGEKDTFKAVKNKLRHKGIKFHENIYKATKYQAIIATEKYRWTTSM